MLKSAKTWLADRRRHLFPSGSLQARLVLGAFWSLIGMVISQALRMVAGISVARLLGKVGYGEYGMLNNTVGTFGIFAGLGLGITATKYVAEFRLKDPVRAGRILGLSTQTALVSGAVSALVMVVLAPLLARSTLNAPHLTGLLRVGCIMLFFNALGGAQTGALAGLEAYKPIASVNLKQGLLSFPLLVIGTWKFALPGAVVATTIISAAGCVLNWRALREECPKAAVPVTHRGTGSELSVLWRFSFPAFLSGVVTGGASWAANTILVRQPAGYGEMGIVGAAMAIRGMIMFIPAAVFSPLLPILSSELNREDGAARNTKLHVVNAYATWYLTTAVTAVLLFFVRPLMPLYGKDFAAGATATMLVLCCIPIITYTDGISRLMRAKSLVWYGTAFNTLWGAVLLASMHFLAKYGASGLGMAYLVAYVLASLVMFPVYFKRLDMVRLARRDLFLGGVLTLALLPGIVSQLASWPLSLILPGLVWSLLALAVTGWMIRRWLSE